SSASRMGFPKAGTISRSISSAVSLPPLPCPRRIVSDCMIGSGHSANGIAGVSEDIVFSERDVHEIPQEMEERRVRLLDAVDRPRRDDEAVIAEVRQAAAVAPGEADREAAALAREPERTLDVRRCT